MSPKLLVLNVANYHKAKNKKSINEKVLNY
jgi:hypothetical protein